MPRGTSPATSPIRRLLLGWYDRNRRDLPWRRTRDPYRIWLSEMMLQQTQVATVIPYYEKFLRAFPTVQALAKSSQDKVLHLWAGLGYYARARNLHRAAQMVVEEFNGRFPDTVDGLLALPGVGRYSAGAIASIAFGRCAAVVDGNVARVLARLFAIQRDVTAEARQEIWQIAESLVPRTRCGEFNQALMELGATVCLPGSAARCSDCPLRRLCRAHAAGQVARLPIKKCPTRVRAETHIVTAIEKNDRWLFVTRPADGLWGGLWELPTIVLNGRPAHKTAQALARKSAGVPCRLNSKPFCAIDRTLSHRKIRFIGYICRPQRNIEQTPSKNQKWLSLDNSSSLGLSNAMREVVAELITIRNPQSKIRNR